MDGTHPRVAHPRERDPRRGEPPLDPRPRRL